MSWTDPNPYRMTGNDTTDREVIGWRVISSHRRFGHWEFLYDDYVLEPNLGKYLVIASERGAERVTLHRLGPLRMWLDTPKRTMKGTKSVKKLAEKLESFV